MFHQPFYISPVLRTIGILIVFFVAQPQLSVAQSIDESSDMEFRASELNKQSQMLTGDASNWAILTALADYDAASNSFTLSDSDLRQIEAFKAHHQKLSDVQTQFESHVEGGATVFAPVATEQYQKLREQYRKNVRDGSTSEAIKTARELFKQIDVIRTTIQRNRTEFVSAILAKKTGEVFRRPGYIGDWLEAQVRDLLERSDGIKTEQESYAFLNFTNGSSVTISPSTIAIVKEMKVDKLTNYTETEVVINEGGLLSSLSDEAKRNGNFTVNTNESSSDVSSSRFWASRDSSEERVTFSNYDGEANVTANNNTVTLQAYQGTIVVRGQNPLPPKSLLPAPKFNVSGVDTVIFRDLFAISWNAVEGASYYEIDHSPSRGFDQNVTTNTSTTNSTTISPVNMGSNFIRVRAYDENGLRGNDSDAFLILRNIDTQPPAVFLSNGKQSIYYSAEKTYSIIGFSEPGSSVYVNKEKAELDADGRFSVNIPVSDDVKTITITATDASGNSTTLTKQIVPIRESQLFKLEWSTNISENTISRAEKISVNGTAYSPLEAVLSLNGETIVAQCGVDGSWSASVNPANAVQLTLSFRFRDSEKIIAQRTYAIR